MKLKIPKLSPILSGVRIRNSTVKLGVTGATNECWARLD